ncbi:MAG: SGNH/GDSL hydrolase family protein [Candidatus Omnitrophica bacterium]|nr:SGNH/GDSL hydrolase family protein [Candidatus Omnitrophota bacterium]
MDPLIIEVSCYLVLSVLFFCLPKGWRLFLGIILLLLAGGEGVLRVYERHLAQKMAGQEAPENLLWIYDAERGWKMKPNARAEFIRMPSGNLTEIKTNSQGLRDEEYALENTTGKKRLLLLGDSLTAGFEVEKPYTIDSQLEILAEDKMEAINAGVRGYGTDQSYLYLKSEGYLYHPDMIVYNFYKNDPRNNITLHNPNRKFGKSYFVIQDGRLVLKGVPVPDQFNPPDIWLMSDPEVQDFYNRQVAAMDTMFPTERVFLYTNPPEDQEGRQREVQGLMIQRLLIYQWIQSWINHNLSLVQWFMDMPVGYRSQSKPDFVLNDEWLVTKALLLEMSRYAESIGAKFLVYEVTSTGFRIADTRMKSICQELRIPYFNSLEKFYKLSRGQPRFHFRNDYHWNEQGHRLAAESLYEELQNRGWL